jgi:integrase
VGRKRRRTLCVGGSPVTVFKRGKKWVCKIYMGRVDGKERQLWKTFATRDEAETYAARLRLDGVPLAPARLTFGEWLDQWLATDRPPSEATATRYEQTVRLHLKPVLGHIRLLKLGPGALENFMERQKERGYSIATIAQNIRVISTALHCAMRRRLITTNPVTLIQRPHPVPSSTAHWDVEQVKLFLGAVQRSPLGSLFITTVATGLRSCEIRALREEDYDPPVLHVRRKGRRVPGRWVFEETLKSRYSRRTLTLPVFAQAALATQITGRSRLLWTGTTTNRWRTTPASANWIVSPRKRASPGSRSTGCGTRRRPSSLTSASRRRSFSGGWAIAKSGRQWTFTRTRCQMKMRERRPC